MGADTAGRTEAFTRGNRMGHPATVTGIEPKSMIHLPSDGLRLLECQDLDSCSR